MPLLYKKGAAKAMVRFARNEQNGYYPGKDPASYALAVKVTEITPELAAVWLGQNTGNRNAKPTAIDKYGRDMQAGAWLLTGEPIIFDSDGTLRNGQNRLRACVHANVPFTSLVVWGIDPDAFAEIDRNIPRTVADVLKIAGEPDAARKCAVLSYIWREAKFNTLRAGGKRVMTVHDAQDMLAHYPEVTNALDWYKPLGKAFIKPTALGPYLFWRLSRINPIKAEEFFTQVASGENLKTGDAIHSLRTVLTEGAVNKARRSEYDQDYVRYLVITAWRFWNANKQITPVALRKAALKLGEEVESGMTSFAGVADV